MICIFLVLCAILIFASIYGLIIEEFTLEKFTLNVGLLFYALFLLVIACTININGSFKNYEILIKFNIWRFRNTNGKN